MLKIKDVEIVKGNLLKVEFENLEVKFCDISIFMDKGNFVELKDSNLFKQFSNMQYSIEWPNQIDLSSDTLYEMGLDSYSSAKHRQLNESKVPYND